MDDISKKAITILTEDISKIKGIGKKRAEILYKKGITTVWDLLCTAPIRFEDRRKIDLPDQLENGRYALIAGNIVSVRISKTLRGTRIFTALLNSFGYEIQLLFFNGNFRSLRYLLKEGTYILAYGKIENDFKIQMIHPNFKIINKSDIAEYQGRIYPIYSEGIKFMANIAPKVLSEVMEALPYDYDILPDRFIKKYELPNMFQAWQFMHIPSEDSLNAANRRMKYNEAVSFVIKRSRFSESIKKSKAFRIVSYNIIDKLERNLPYELTADQRKAITDISELMNKNKAMFHLLQGDVGSGKTVVAIAAALAAAENGYQTAFMAPTDLLAHQHFHSMNHIAVPLSLKTVMLTGKQSTKSQNESREKIKSGRASIVVGTHALISKKTEFAKLGLAVIDEQQRFGVLQREALINKSICPHLLMLTATPIPRTLLMTYYKELTVSELKQIPEGRKPVKTRVVIPENREKMYRFIEKHIEKGELCYVVLPLIDESEKLNLKNVKTEYEHLREIFSFKIEMLHGQMDTVEREKVMERFRNGQTKIVVSTTVVEVGVDVANATIMLIENASRFGMSQIHQLRGRVGRASIQSYCFLAVSDRIGEDALQRLKFLESCNDGFLISIEDLKIRGPGQFIGENQSGFAGFRYLNWQRDITMIRQITRDIAPEMVSNPVTAALLG